MNLSTAYRGFRARMRGLVLSPALLLAAMACAPASAPTLTADAVPYRPVRVASGLAARPGSLVWSPDGRRLAFISDGAVAVLDAAAPSTTARRLDVPPSRYLAWADDGTLYALAAKEDRDVLFLIDVEHSGMTKVSLDRRVDAVHPVDRRSTFLLSLRLSRRKIGTETDCVLSRLDLATGSTTTLHGYSRIFPTTTGEENALTAWADAGPNPLDGSFLIMEHIKPPALPPYTLVRAFDPASGDLVEFGSQDRRTIYASAAWSPDGRRLALTERNGGLVIRSPLGTRPPFESPAAGRYAAWHPAGDTLMVGGALVNTATGQVSTLVSDAGTSYSRWSPDGTRLAVITQGDLLLLSGVPPAAPSRTPLDVTLKKKLMMLQELARDGLVGREDYETRRSRLLQEKEDHQ